MSDIGTFMDACQSAYDALRQADITEGNDTPWEDVELHVRLELATAVADILGAFGPGTGSDLIYGYVGIVR